MRAQRPLRRSSGFFKSLPFRIVAFCLVAAIVLIGSFAAWRIIVHNEGVVQPGQLYRSAQLTVAELQDEIAKNGIRTVINLRGENKNAAWYQQEVALCSKLRVQHFDVSFSAKHLPPPSEAARLLDILQAAPRPILLHCRSGADRTGLAASVFLMAQDHMPWKQASRALNWQYGHLAIYPYFEMDEFVQLYGQSANPSIDDWTRHTYPSVYASEMHESKWDEMMEPVELLVRGRLD